MDYPSGGEEGRQSVYKKCGGRERDDRGEVDTRKGRSHVQSNFDWNFWYLFFQPVLGHRVRGDSRGGKNHEDLFVDSLFDHRHYSDFRRSKFRRSSYYNKISLVEIWNLFGLPHLRIDRFRNIVRPSFLDSKSLTGIVAVEKFKSRVSFSLTITVGKVHHGAIAMIPRRDILHLPEIKSDLTAWS